MAQAMKKKNADISVLMDSAKKKPKKLNVNRDELVSELINKRWKLDKLWHR